MQNHLNSCLYNVEGNFPFHIDEQGYEVKVELYDTKAKIEEITAYTFHPNKTSWWNRAINWFIEFFYGRTAVLVRVEGELSLLYVRVDDLSRILDISSQAILRASKEEDVTDFLAEHQMRQTANKVKALVEQEGVFWMAPEENSIKELIEEIGYHNVFKVLDGDEFDGQRMALTLIEVGKQLAQYSTDGPISQTVYDFKVSLPNIFIWKIEDFKKTQINLRDLIVTEEDLLKQTADKISKLAQKKGMRWTQIEQDSIEALIRQLGYQNVLNVINDPHFYPDQMACTLVEAGREIAGVPVNDSKQKNFYEFQVDLPHLYIWKVENYKKTKIDLENLVVTFEDLPRVVHSPHISPSKIFPTLPLTTKKKSPTLLNKLTKIFTSNPDKQELEFKNIMMVLGVDPKKMKQLASLADRVGYTNLILTLGRLPKDEKNIMMNTFIDIGQQLSMPAFLDGIFANFRLKYAGKQKQEKKQLTCAFAINKKDIFIVRDKLAEGGFKIVSTAIKLNNLEDPFVRIKIKNDKNSKDVQDLKQTRASLQEVRKEAKFIEELHKRRKESGSDCIVLPFACEIISNKGNNTVIFFQKKYDGDGEKLQKASLFQKVHVLKDVAKGLAFIHKLGFVHMDVKPANFLIEGDLNGFIPARGRVSDFGMTREIGKEIPGGSFAYLAPEALVMANKKLHFRSGCYVNDKLDSFAFGITILEILGKLSNKLFGVLNQMQIDHEMQQYKQQIQSASSKNEDRIKLALLELAQKLLKHNSTQRMSCNEAAGQLEKLSKDQGNCLIKID